MASRQPNFARFFNQYKRIYVFLGCLQAVQLFLAFCVIILHSDSNQSNELHQQSLPQDFNGVNQGGHMSSLDYSSLSFVPECEQITIKESISAIQRAKSDGCKEQLAKTACKIIHGSLYPSRLPRYCVHKEATYGKYLGCFQDEQKKRILPDFFTLMKENNSPINCIDLCLRSGFQYAGVQYSIECFCGNAQPSETLLLKDPTKCKMKCPSIYSTSIISQKHHIEKESGSDFTGYNDTTTESENISQKILPSSKNEETPMCGGFFTMNIYETGVYLDAETDNKIVTLQLQDIVGKEVPVVKKPVRIVFFLTLNGRAYRQVIRLIKSLFHERHFFYIHVDARQDYLYRELLNLARKLPNNLRFMSNRRATIWGGASLLTVLLTAMHDLVSHADEWNWQWDYVINLSESDFPLKTTKQLETFLSLNNGGNFIKSHGKDVQKFIQKQGLDKTFHECDYRMWRMGDRKLPAGIVMDGGSDWIALHRNFVEYIVQSDDKMVQGLKDVFRHTLLPAESFFHTVLRNSAMCRTFVDNNLHVANWKRKLGCKCQYRNVVDWCGCSPNDFRLSDWNRLQLTDNRLLFFARKFEPVVSQGIINKLEAKLYPERYISHEKTSDRFWQSIFHHHDLSPKPDDSVLTLGYSLSRIATEHFFPKYYQYDSRKMYSHYRNQRMTGKGLDNDFSEDGEDYDNDGSLFLKLLKMNVYLQDDKIKGILVRFHKEISSKEHVILEAWYKLKVQRISTVSTLPDSKKILNVQVGLDYDQKEQIFRHFSRSMGPTSAPTLAFNVITDDPFNITFVWINPIQSIQAIVNIRISKGSTANFVKPALKTPLLPGNWTVKLLSSEGILLSQAEFLVLPLQFYRGLPISSTQSRIMHTAPSYDDTDDQPHLRLDSSKPSHDLLAWIDSLVSSHYEFQDICVENELHLSKKRDNSWPSEEIPICSLTDWSSQAPDPKSQILGLDEITGLLIP